MSNRVGRRQGSQTAQLDALLDSYAERHKRCLFDESYQGQYTIVSMGDSFSGLGNRMLSVVTGMVLALMTDRCFFLRHDTYHREFKNAKGLDMRWLHPRTEAAAQHFRKANFGPFTVGLQVRTQKPLGAGLADPSVRHYCTLARAVQLKQNLPDDQIKFFIATDSEKALAEIRRTLGPDRVVSMDGGAKEGVKEKTRAGDPGTEESAVLDMRLLSMTDALLVTSASSFGYVAAAWGGIVPIHVLHRGDKPSMLNPYFYIPMDTEPCYWGAHRYFMDNAPKEAVDLLKENPMWMQYAHCQ
ncbi:g5233 [Coccomyxa elongata]